MAVSDALQYGAHHSQTVCEQQASPDHHHAACGGLGRVCCCFVGALRLLLFTRGVVVLVVVDGLGRVSSGFFTIDRLDLGQTIPKFRLQATSVAREPDRMFTSNLGN